MERLLRETPHSCACAGHSVRHTLAAHRGVGSIEKYGRSGTLACKSVWERLAWSCRPAGARIPVGHREGRSIEWTGIVRRTPERVDVPYALPRSRGDVSVDEDEGWWPDERDTTGVTRVALAAHNRPRAWERERQRDRRDRGRCRPRHLARRGDTVPGRPSRRPTAFTRMTGGGGTAHPATVVRRKRTRLDPVIEPEER